MHDVTRILSGLQHGDPRAAAELLPLVYDELRKLAAQRMAAERPDHTLEATALVHEAYLRLVDAEKVPHWNTRGHFFGAAAEAMRRILVENARARLLDQQLIGDAELNELTALLKRHLEDPETLVLSSVFIQAWGRTRERP